MREHVVSEPVVVKRIQGVVGAIDRPVPAQLLGTQHQHALVLQFKIFDYRQGGERLSQPDAIGENAAVQGLNLVDHRFRAVILERVQRSPDAGIGERDPVQVDFRGSFAVNEVPEDVEQRQVVDELRRLVCIQAFQFAEHYVFHVFGQVIL